MMMKHLRLFVAVCLSGCIFGPAAQAQTVFELVTDATTLAEGQQFIIVNTEYNRAIKTSGNSTSRDAVTVQMEDDNVVNPSSTAQVYTLTLQDGHWLLAADGGYLYASSSSSRQLKHGTPSHIDDAYAQIAINASGEATIVLSEYFQYNTIRYNRSATQFVCCKNQTEYYAVSLYRKRTETTAIERPATYDQTAGEGQSEAVYRLDGTRLRPDAQTAAHGLLIVGGRKVLKK